METEFAQIAKAGKLGTSPSSLGQSPLLVYLARLAPGSRRTMRGALDVIAALLTGGRQIYATVAWHGLHYQHTQAIRAKLAETYAPACLTSSRHFTTRTADTQLSAISVPPISKRRMIDANSPPNRNLSTETGQFQAC